MKKLIKESGLRDIKKLSQRYPKAKIYFHQDLDGVTTAIAMKKYLEDNGIKVVDTEVIQYGDKEFSIKKMDAQGDTMPVLVDFAHGKPMFVIHTDHHDRQAGAEETGSKSFRPSRSNVETISQIVSTKDIFPETDLRLISTVDSADFAKYNITPEQVMNYIFKLDRDKTPFENKFALGLVLNKLLLAFKNKPGFLETLVMKSEPSLYSILDQIKGEMKSKSYAKPEDLERNREDYINQMKQTSDVSFDNGVIVQYGGGKMFKPGSYDRYTPFKNNPDADFLVIAWPLGLLQASCNPFKKERELKGVNLGEIAQEVLSKWESQLKERRVPLSTVKYISESKINPESVGFTMKDFKAIYGDRISNIENGDKFIKIVDKIMSKPFKELTESEFSILDKVTVSAWDIIQANSGGHKCITNISGLSYLGRAPRPNDDPYRFNPEHESAPYIKFVKMLQKEFVTKLKEKIQESKQTS